MRDAGRAEPSVDDPWSKEDIQDLQELLLLGDGLSIVEMAAILRLASTLVVEFSG